MKPSCKFKFGDSIEHSIGSIALSIPFGLKSFDCIVQVVNADITLLLGLDVMRKKVRVDMVNMRIKFREESGQLVMEWLYKINFTKKSTSPRKS